MKIHSKDENILKKRFHGLFGFLNVYLNFIKGHFLQLDDQLINGLLARQQNEQANVALVGALLMTITFSFIPVTEDWENNWIKGLFELFVAICNGFIVICVSLSTTMILILNVCKDDLEAAEFISRIGVLELVPFQCLWGAIFMFGFCVSLTLYYHITIHLPNFWFICICLISYLPSMILLPLAVYHYVVHIYAIRDDNRTISLVLDSVSCQEEFSSYISTQFNNSIEELPHNGHEFDDFTRYLQKKHGTKYIGRKTYVRLKELFKEKLGELEQDNSV
mmetsp:Transcript_24788/g.25417  ORF Transcript_24788/g.25417 Transcript_24788/m.25417 type:complete len:278 (+) Transcript_24788:43-876(+)